MMLRYYHKGGVYYVTDLEPIIEIQEEEQCQSKE